jgi:hypothetical protein
MHNVISFPSGLTFAITGAQTASEAPLFVRPVHRGVRRYDPDGGILGRPNMTRPARGKDLCFHPTPQAKRMLWQERRQRAFLLAGDHVVRRTDHGLPSVDANGLQDRH